MDQKKPEFMPIAKAKIKPPEPPGYQEIRCALCGTPEGLSIVPVNRFNAIVATISLCRPCLEQQEHLSIMFVDPFDVIKIM